MTNQDDRERTPLLPNALQTNHTESTPWWKVDLNIMTTMALFFLSFYVNRMNFANATLAGMQKDLDISDPELSTALMLTWIPYILTILPATFLVKSNGASVALPSMALIWGIASLTQGFSRNALGFTIARVFIGLAQGGFIPSVVLYVSGFYPKEKLPMRVSLLYTTSSLAGVVSGLFAAIFIKFDGVSEKADWAWVLILEGLVPTLLSLVAPLALPKKFEELSLATEEQRKAMKSVLEREQTSSEQDDDVTLDYAPVTFSDFKSVIVVPRTILLTLASFFAGIMELTWSSYGPTIVKNNGFSPVLSQVVSTPPFILAFGVSISALSIAQSHNSRALSCLLMSALSLVGLGLYLVQNSTIRYISLFLSIPGSLSISPLLTNWSLTATKEANQRVISLGVSAAGHALGGIVACWVSGPWLSTDPGEGYDQAAVVFLMVASGALIGLFAWLRWFAKDEWARI